MTKTQRQIDPCDLVAMDEFARGEPLRVDLVYARGDHPENIFKTGIYRRDARLWLHRDLAAIALRAAQDIHREWGALLVLKDGLRTVEAQLAMQQTAIVRANPQWSAEGPGRLLSPPGKGGHPRGMAVDATIADDSGREWDMGTPFDYLTTDPAHNPAARDFSALPAPALENRCRLTAAMQQAAAREGRDLLPLPAEWWDFRFPASYYNTFAPLSDADLPPEIRMTAGQAV